MFVSPILVIDQIMSMIFDTNKALRYDPSKVLHQRRLDVNLRGYEAEHDEVLATLANTDLFEQIEVGIGSSNSSERNRQSYRQAIRGAYSSQRRKIFEEALY